MAVKAAKVMTKTSIRRTSDGRGFTLIELLVTLVIMGLLAGLATLSVGGSAHRQARDEAQRLYQVLRVASEEASLQGEEYGLLIDQEAYSMMQFDAGEQTWNAAVGRHFSAHEMPGSVRFDFRPEQQTNQGSPGIGNRDSGASPQVLVLSSGEISAFEILFYSSDSPDPAARIGSDGSGTINWD
jgi:general secretion pathway protein H